MRAERDLLGPSCDRSAHGLVGVLVRPGGVVGLLPCVVVVVAVGAAVVGELVRPGGVVGAVVGATVRVGGATVPGGTTGVETPVVGTLVGPPGGVVESVVDDGCVEELSDGPSPGVTVWPPVGRGV